MKNIRSILIASVIAVASMTSVSAGAVSTVDNSSFNVSKIDGATVTKTYGVSHNDVKVTDAVATAILSASVDKDWRVYSSAKNGIVTLEGFVSNNEDSHFAEKIASNVKTVKGVKNKLVVGEVPDVPTPVKLVTAAEEDAALAK